MIESTAMAMDRLRVMKERIRSREEATQERYRGNLLRAISHDLRTPLAGIMGTSEMIGRLWQRCAENRNRTRIRRNRFRPISASDTEWFRSTSAGCRP